MHAHLIAGGFIALVVIAVALVFLFPFGAALLGVGLLLAVLYYGIVELARIEGWGK